jgi:hypothetical protein
LLISSTIPSPLMAALPFVFLTNESHIISPATLQTSHQPQTVQITKHFFTQHVEDIKKEFEGVKALGSATTEEWLKGLDGVGKERRNDSARWERWEISGGLTKMRISNLETPRQISQPEHALPAKLQGHPQANGNLPPFRNPTPLIQHHLAQPAPSLLMQPQSNFREYILNSPAFAWKWVPLDLC